MERGVGRERGERGREVRGEEGSREGLLTGLLAHPRQGPEDRLPQACATVASVVAYAMVNIPDDIAVLLSVDDV